jgi:hypothetical protein
MTDILELTITYPATERTFTVTLQRIDGRAWCAIGDLWKPGIQCADADTPEQALMIALAISGICATVHDVNAPGMNVRRG